MRSARKIFLDSDVVISSLISSLGAASFLIRQTDMQIFVSDISCLELWKVVEKMELSTHKLENLIKENLKIVRLGSNLERTKKKFADYVLDENDAHVIAGAVKAKAKFLISYNLRHFKVDKIKTDFDILILTPARFLQYLRSL